MTNFLLNSEDDDLLSICLIFAAVMYYNSLRTRHRLTRSAIVSPEHSPWAHIIAHADPGSFLNLTGFTRQAFHQLASIIFPLEPVEIGLKRGRPSLLNDHGQLGLYLFYLGSKMHLKHLCLIFGVTPTTAQVYIDRVMELICEHLVNHPLCKIKMANPAERQTYAHMIQAREPLIHNCIGFIDGLAVPIECSDDVDEQDTFYNGYHHDTTCNSVFAFAPTGKIIFAAINHPGSWHDATVCKDLIQWAINNLGDHVFCVDQAFPRSGQLYGKFVGPMSASKRRKLSPVLREALITLHNLYTSLRQAAEWGMRAMEGTFARLKSRLTSNYRKRHMILLSIALLTNLRVELVGLNQIATVFNPEYEQIIKLDNYDRIARYFGEAD